jgi:hypothetical protein
MAASSDAVDGTKVGGASNIVGGTNHQNGAVATLADDITSINAANANRQPVDLGMRRGKVGKMYGAEPTGAALPTGFKDGGY